MRNDGGSVSEIDAVVCDLDGVLYRGHEPILGAADAIGALQARGLEVVFATNNATRSVSDYVDRLATMGIEAAPDDIVTSSVVTTEEVLLRGWADRSFFVIGSPNMRSSLESVGVKVVDGPEGRAAEVVLVSADPNFSYDAMRTAVFALAAGADFIASNADPTFPASDGLWPGAGALLAGIELASGRRAEVMGKPHPPMMSALQRRLDGRAGVAVIGDQDVTDLAGARAVGWTTVLVLSGVTDEEQGRALDPAPDVIVPTIATLVEMLDRD